MPQPRPAMAATSMPTSPAAIGSSVAARIARLFVYPVKSCAGVELQAAISVVSERI